ncbi:pentatricopeptide repeat-containing protein At3g22670, mitochondrial-like [Neltuma alba]|uniref:pentatricopeptide repeat-containing protein At3g22670, mitochondrial-like n=1 Tax=Neltuma alba TaxID=207710 RepID=UPI0010A4BA05|nr:pentatricopeptide repeat-containing protein At3g22670, mitochondrial-like [Prosopis alba]
MLAKLRILKVIHHRLPQRLNNSNGLCYILYSNPLCTMVDSQLSPESPELPVWVKLPDTQSPESADSGEDFVILAPADWAEAHMLNGQTQMARLSSREKKDENNVIAISRVLKELHPSLEKVAESLERYDFLVSENLVEKILNIFCNDWIRALEFFIWAKTQTAYVHSPKLYNFMIGILGKAKKFDLVWNLVEEMHQLEGYLTFDKGGGFTRQESTKKLWKHSEIWSGKAGQLSEVLDLYEIMKSDGCVPDPQFYSSLIFIFGQAGRLKDARDLFDDMPKQRVIQDVRTYNTVISIACKHSQEETALRLLMEMEEKSCKPNVETYHPLLKMCLRKKRMKVVNFLLGHMFRNDVSLDLTPYSLLMIDLCKWKT